MTSSDLVAALAPVATCLEILGVRYYLGGSLASSTHGIPRASLDVDIVAELATDHITPLAQHLRSAYYVPEDHMRAAVLECRSFNLIHLVTMFKVDVFVSQRRPFDRQACDRARPEPIDDTLDAPRYPVASPEDTVLAKLEWFRRGGETSERQWWDVVGVLKVARGGDRHHMRRWAPALGVADLLERALEDALE